MITEDYVSFETAKLLKEKGFYRECMSMYVTPKPHAGMGNPNEAKIAPHGRDSHYYDGYLYQCEAPTLQMAMKLLREEHNILIVVDYEYECDTTPYFFKIYRLGDNGKPERIAVKGVSYDKDNNQIEHIVGYRDWERSEGDYSTFEEACKMGIKYCLENLI